MQVSHKGGKNGGIGAYGKGPAGLRHNGEFSLFPCINHRAADKRHQPVRRFFFHIVGGGFDEVVRHGQEASSGQRLIGASLQRIDAKRRFDGF